MYGKGRFMRAALLFGFNINLIYYNWRRIRSEERHLRGGLRNDQLFMEREGNKKIEGLKGGMTGLADMK